MRRKQLLIGFTVSTIVFITGLALGAGKSSDDTSAANTASKILLVVGLLALVATGIVWVLAHRKGRRDGATAAEHVSR